MRQFESKSLKDIFKISFLHLYGFVQVWYMIETLRLVIRIHGFSARLPKTIIFVMDVCAARVMYASCTF